MVTFLRSDLYKYLILLVLLTVFSMPGTSFAQVKFSAVCLEKKIGKNDLLQIQFKVENASHIESIIPPRFKNFTIVSGPNQQSGMTNINGNINQYTAISFSLQPKSTGKFVIGTATALADGKKLTSAPLSIEVTNASTSPSNNNSANSLPPFGNFNFDLPPMPLTHSFDDYILKPGEKAEDKIQKNIFIKLNVSKKDCYVGEPITASYKLYTRLRSESTITDAPSFNGFSVSDLDVNQNNASIEKYNGRQYNVYTLRKVQLYPLQPGNITLGPLVSDNKITFIKSEYANTRNNDMFYDLLEGFADATAPQNTMVEQNVTLESKPVVIIVKALPGDNKPSDFKGAVGQFHLSCSLENDKITTDDAGNLKITISGKGNIELINAPKISWPEGIESYDVKVKDDVDKTSVPMEGSKTFTFPFTISKPGKYKIGTILFSYFDPATSSYKTLHATLPEVQVTKGRGVPNNLYAKNSGKPEKVDDIFFTTNRTNLIAGSILLVIIIFITLFFIRKKNKSKQRPEKNLNDAESKNPAKEKEPEFIIPENPLLPAHEKLAEQNATGFYQVLDASLKKYLSAKFKVPAEELTKKRLNEELDKCDVSLGTSHLLNSLTEEIEINLYAPPSNTNHMIHVFEKASEVVSLLDKQVCD